TGSAAWMMTATWDAPHMLLLWAMWAAMMAGMMLPSAAPIVLLRIPAHCERPFRLNVNSDSDRW
ncbi:MAG: hypothetical protein OEW24_09515, partial [Chloroflexota bacterium]|nr:hypothetical protein [Chloroflexota bacterium]